MKIECRINIIKKDNLIGYADLTLEDSFVIKGVSILNGRNGIFISFPQKKVGDKYYDIVFPIKKELRDNITKIVLEKYNKEEIYEENKHENNIKYAPKQGINTQQQDQDDQLPF